MKLTQYHAKRDFSRTREPKGKIAVKIRKKGNLFVIQKHAASHLHYDFRLELSGVLVSWAVPKGPCLDPSIKRLAVHVEDHPIEYGSFEGLIPKGQYGGGTVMLWDQGKWLCKNAHPVQSYQNGDLSIVLTGKKLNGEWKLIRINKDDKTWLLIKVNDKYARSLKDYDITKAEPDSVSTGRTLEEIKNNNIFFSEINQNFKPTQFPKLISPELATLVDQPPMGKNWIHEIKFDGYRIIAFKKAGHVRLFTRHQLDWTNKFKNIAAEIAKLNIDTAIFDGEIVVLDDNQISNFQLLQNAIKDKENNFIYYVFDLLYIDKYNITSLPLLERKKLLKLLLPEQNYSLRFSDHIIGSGKKIFKNICKMGLEGIISKDANSVYI